VHPLAREQLGVLMSALERSHSEVVHRKLCSLMADLLQLSGEICFDSNNYTEAAHCYTLAATACKEADAYDLWACALTRHAFIGVYEQQFATAKPLLDRAAHIARAGDRDLSTRYWVSAVQAQSLAGLGDFEGCQRALGYADQVHELDGRIHYDGWLRFDGTRLPEERGACYTTLKRTDLAERSLNAALGFELSQRRRGGVFIDLATLGLQQGDIDQAVIYADAAIEVARKTQSGWVGRKLSNLSAQLRPHLGDQRVRQLSEQLTSITTMARES
jgi:tetratricopeptide (TPR) repeat protein